MMDSIGALLVALVGASVGAYFAVLKSRKERLWLDRYETLRDIVVSLGTVESAFSSSHLAQLGVSAMGRVESQKLSEDWPVSMHSLRQNLAKLRLLFKETEIAALRDAAMQLQESFTDMYHGDDLHQPELHAAISEKASAALEAAVAVGQRHCL